MSDEHPGEDPEDSGEGFAWGFSRVEAGDWEASNLLAPPSSVSGPLRVPEGTFGPYEILGVLGRGGMGVVLRARDPEIDREIAIKVILEKNLQDTSKARFRREGQVTAKLTHPGIVRVHTAGEIDGLLFLAYELVPDCRELEAAFDERDLPGRVELVRDAARALGYAHSQGVVHRDVKPANVLVDAEGRVKVTDFGLAAVRGADRLTQTGAFVGTPTHMAPEQFAPTPENPVGPHTDVWGLGVILYRALTGGQPFQGGSLLELGAAIVAATPPPPRTLNPKVTPDLQAICQKALSAECADRYPSATAMAEDLESALQGDPVSASTGTHSGFLALRRRWPQLPLILLSGCATLLLIGAVLWSTRAPDGLAQSQAERKNDLRVHELEQRSQRLFGSHRALASEHPALARLADQAQKLERKIGGATPAPLAQTLLRIRVMQGLLELSRGDTQSAEALAEEIDLSPISDALRGALLATRALDSTLASEAERVIDRGVKAGCERIDLHAWRALARLRSGRLVERAEARKALALLGGLANAQDGALPEPLRLVKARLHLREAQVPLAVRAIAALRDPPRDLLHELAFARAGLLLDDRRHEEALALLLALDLDRAVAQRPRAQLYDRLAATAKAAFQERELDRLSAIAILEAMRRLEPEVDLPRRYVQTLVDEITVRDTRALHLLSKVGSLAPNDAEVFAQLAKAVVRTEKSEAIEPNMDLIERAIALAPNDAKRVGLKAFKCFALQEIRKPKECLALCDEILPKIMDAQVLGRIHYARGWSRRRLGDLEGALEDLDKAQAVVARPQSRFMNFRVELLWALERWDQCLREAVHYAGEAPSDSGKHAGTVMTVWELARKFDRLEVLEPTIGRLLKARPRLAGWWARLAWTFLKLGRQEDAASALERAARGFVLGHTKREAFSPEMDERIAALAPRTRRLVTAIREGAPSALDDFKPILDQLDRLRRGNSVP